MKKAKRAIAAVALATSLAVGGAAVAMAAPGLAGAAEAAATGTVSWVGNALSGLVSDGTITQTQADAVQKALDSARPEGMKGPGGPHGPHGPGGGPMNDAAVAEVLGLTQDQIRTALQSGQNLAQLAAQQGVDVQKVVDVIVAGMKTHLAEEVASGEHTQAEADQILADAQTRITDMINGKMPAGGPGDHQRGPRPDGRQSGTGMWAAPGGAAANGQSRAS